MADAVQCLHGLTNQPGCVARRYFRSASRRRQQNGSAAAKTCVKSSVECRSARKTINKVRSPRSAERTVICHRDNRLRTENQVKVGSPLLRNSHFFSSSHSLVCLLFGWLSQRIAMSANKQRCITGHFLRLVVRCSLKSQLHLRLKPRANDFNCGQHSPSSPFRIVLASISIRFAGSNFAK